MSDMIERAAKAIYFAGDGNIWAEDFHDQIWAGSQGLRDEDYEIDGGDEYDDVLVRGRNWYRAQARAALLAALDPEVIRPMIEEKIKTHYWNHHGARDPSSEFVDDLAGMLVIGLQQMAQGHPSSQEQVRASLSDTEREDGK